MRKSFIIKFVVLFLFSMVFIVSTLYSFAFGTNNKEARLTKHSYSNGFLNLKGETNSDLLKVLIKNNGNEKWLDLEINNGYFDKKIILENSSGIYDLYIMIHEGNYDFSYGPQIKVIFSNIDSNKTSQNNNKLTPKSGTYNGNKDYTNTLNSREIQNKESFYDNRQLMRSGNLSESYSADKYLTSSVSRNDKIEVSIDDSSIRSLAISLTKNYNTDYEKARSIYDWVSNNITYDRDKLKRMQKNDYSDEFGAMVAFNTRKGVCYDYACLISELAKISGLDVYLVKGDYLLSNGSTEYHAWNEIFIKEQNRWIKMDSTLGSVQMKNYFDNDGFDKNHVKTSVE